MLSDPSHIPVDDSARRSAFNDMDFRYGMASTSPLSHSHSTRIARLQDGRPIERWERDGEMYDPLSKSPPGARRREESTLPTLDFSTLTLGVPQIAIANTANDPLVVSTSPPQRRRLPVSAKRQQPNSCHRKKTQDEGVKLVDLALTMVVDGVTPIEEITVEHHQREREPVPGIDTKRPSIGVTRPSDEDNHQVGERNRKFVEGWAGDERHEGSRRGMSGDGQMQSPESKRKSVNFTPITTTPITRYYNPRKESDFSTTSSGSGSGSGTSFDYPLIYSPQESPPLDVRQYSGTILDLVSDPQEIREYRHLERRKEMDRRESGNSASSGNASVAGSRSGSINLGRTADHGFDFVRKGSVGEQSNHHTHSNQHGRNHLAHSPRTGRTTLGEQSLVDSVDSATSSSPANRRSLPEDNTCLSSIQIKTNGFHTSSHASPTSPISSSPVSQQQLFHPDLHPVADHHVPRPSHHDTRDMLADLNNISQSDSVIYTHSADPDLERERGAGQQATQQALASLTDSSSTDDTSPSSSGTVRPPLALEDGRLKARTVADFRAEDAREDE